MDLPSPSMTKPIKKVCARVSFSSDISDSEETLVTMKLVINKTTKKVVYAEAGKDFVDFLFHVLVLPVGAAMKHFEPDTINIGSLGNLYKSVEDFDANLIRHKDFLLNPRAAAPAAAVVPLWPLNDRGAPPIMGGEYYTCRFCGIVCDVEGRCARCSEKTKCLSLQYVAPRKLDPRDQGYVGDKVLYIVSDDLVVKPLCSDNVLLLLLNNNVGATDMNGLESRVVSIDTNHGMALLKASLFSKTVLTDAFLRDCNSVDSDAKNI